MRIDLFLMICAKVSSHPEDFICIISEMGYAFQYEVSQIPQVSGKTKGVKSMNLQKDDCIADIAIGNFTDGQFLIVTSQAQMKRMKTKDIVSLKRPAKGNRICKLVKSNPSLISKIFYCEPKYTFTIYSQDLYTFEAKEIPIMNEQATFSNPFGKLNSFEWIENLEEIKKGEWIENEQNKEIQISLFDMES